MDRPIHCLILGLRVRIDCADGPLRELLVANFGAMSVAECGAPEDLHYAVVRRTKSPPFVLRCRGQRPLTAGHPDDLLYLVEKSLILDLQKARSDLFFLHAAAVERNGRACLLAGESGAGKSTTAWGLLHHDFNYLSDELSPVDLHTMRVLPYAHALCLKTRPPAPYSLPDTALDLGGTIHIPVDALPCPASSVAQPLAGLFFVKYVPGLVTPELTPISSGEAAARLYVHVLNALAHPASGIDATVRIARHAPGFVVSAGQLSSTCDAIRDVIG